MSRVLPLVVLCPLLACNAPPTCDNAGGTVTFNGQAATTCKYSTQGGAVTVNALVSGSTQSLNLRLSPGVGTFTCNGGGASVMYIDASNTAYGSTPTYYAGNFGSCSVTVTAEDSKSIAFRLNATVIGEPSVSAVVSATGHILTNADDDGT